LGKELFIRSRGEEKKRIEITDENSSLLQLLFFYAFKHRNNDGVVVEVIIRFIKRCDLVKIKPRESGRKAHPLMTPSLMI